MDNHQEAPDERSPKEFTGYVKFILELVFMVIGGFLTLLPLVLFATNFLI